MSLIAEGLELTINWHIAMHYSHFIRLDGPVSGYNTWAFERHNGYLARRNYFRGNKTQMTATAMRHWLRAQLFDAVLDHVAPNASEDEQRFLEDQKRLWERKTVQGTQLMDEQRYNAANRTITLPQANAARVNLKNMDATTPRR